MAAMLFRRSPISTAPPRPGVPDPLIFRDGEPPSVPDLPPAGRPTAHIEPPALRPRPPASPLPPAESLAPTDPGRPPPELAGPHPGSRDVTGFAAGPSTTERAGIDPSGELVRSHEIVDGDTLGDLAEQHLGDARRYLEIYEANRHLLPSPEVLPIGVKITIPPKETRGPARSDLMPQEPLVPVPPVSP